jgi:hypothetical protein
VRWLDISVVAAHGKRLRISQGFLELGGEFVCSHGAKPSLAYTWSRTTPFSRLKPSEQLDWLD